MILSSDWSIPEILACDWSIRVMTEFTMLTAGHDECLRQTPLITSNVPYTKSDYFLSESLLLLETFLGNDWRTVVLRHQISIFCVNTSSVKHDMLHVLIAVIRRYQ